MSDPRVSVAINTVVVMPGEALTVYLRPDVGRGKQYQVELRVLDTGEPQVFSDLPMRPWRRWRSKL